MFDWSMMHDGVLLYSAVKDFQFSPCSVVSLYHAVNIVSRWTDVNLWRLKKGSYIKSAKELVVCESNGLWL